MKTDAQPPSREAWESLVRHTAATLAYPPTPNVADAVVARLAAEDKHRPAMRHSTARLRLLWVTGMLLAALAGLWAMPPVRAAIREVLQIGAVRIRLAKPTSVPAMTPQSTPQPPTVVPTIVRLHHFDLVGETTLDEAEAQAGFVLSLPTYPHDIGPPDAVFFQEFGAPMVVMVWMSHTEPGKALYSLQILGSDAIVTKVDPPVVETTRVNGVEAAWTHGPYLLAYGAENAAEWRLSYLVTGRVLIWHAAGLTYRLESDLSLEEAVRMAESLEPRRE